MQVQYILYKGTRYIAGKLPDENYFRDYLALSSAGLCKGQMPFAFRHVEESFSKQIKSNQIKSNIIKHNLSVFQSLS